jgi:hypothetical protein
MRRLAIALAALLVAVSLAACAPDVIALGDPRSARPADSAAGSGAEALGPSASAVCGVDVTTDAAPFMLTPNDVWPGITRSGQGFNDVTLDPDACRARLTATPTPRPADCERGFPYYPFDEQVTELARDGVLAVHAEEILDIGRDGNVAAAVHEWEMQLSPGAAAAIAALATSCGATPAGDTLATTTNGSLDMLVHVDDNHAIALTFDVQTKLTDTQKRRLLTKAEALATD